MVRLNAVAKLYRRQLIISFPFLEGLFYEDVYGGIGILKHIKKMVKINYIGYYYRVRSGSIMNREFNTKNLDLFTICDKVEKLYNDDKKALSYVYRRLFNLVLMHVIDYKIFEGNPYKEKYSNYFECSHLLKKKPKNLSGGEKQRIALQCEVYDRGRRRSRFRKFELVCKTQPRKTQKRYHPHFRYWYAG